jgi:hypothetical protein
MRGSFVAVAMPADARSPDDSDPRRRRQLLVGDRQRRRAPLTATTGSFGAPSSRGRPAASARHAIVDDRPLRRATLALTTGSVTGERA